MDGDDAARARRSASVKAEFVKELLSIGEPFGQLRFAKWMSMSSRGIAAFARAHANTFRRRTNRGIPQRFRWESWKVAFNFEAHHESLHARYRDLCARDNEYTPIIQVDVPRTFPELKIFDKEAQAQLSRILASFALNPTHQPQTGLANLQPSLGYCQGMNFVAGLLLLVSGFQELEAFVALVGMMNDFKLAQFYQPSFPLVQQNILAFEYMCKELHPELHVHFIREDVSVAVFLHQWYLTLFVVSLPLRMVVTLWDYILYNGIESVLPVSLGLLNLLEPQLRKLKFEGILSFLKDIKATDSKDDIRAGRVIINQAYRITQDHGDLTELVKRQDPNNCPQTRVDFSPPSPQDNPKEPRGLAAIAKKYLE